MEFSIQIIFITSQHAHSHRQHSPTWATTQDFLVFIRHPEPQLKRCHSEPQLKECHMLNPCPEPQLKGYVPSHNSRNTSKPTFKVSSKSCRPHTSKTSITLLPHQYHLALLMSRQAQQAFRPPGGGHILLGAKHLCNHCPCNYRQTVPLQEPKNNIAGMSCLAAVHHPLGGFWKNSRNPEI